MRRILALLLLASVAAAGCGNDEPESDAITIAETAQPDFLDPALSYTLNGWEPMWLVYTPLLTYRHAEGKEGDTDPGPRTRTAGDLVRRQDIPLPAAGRASLFRR